MGRDAIAVLVLVALGFGVGWGVNGWRLEGRIASLRAEHAEAVAKGARDVLDANKRRQDERDAQVAALGKIDKDNEAKRRKDRKWELARRPRP